MSDITDLIKKIAIALNNEFGDVVDIERTREIIEIYIEKSVDGNHMNEIADLFGELQ